MDEWIVDVWMDRWTDRQLNGQIDGWKGVRVDRYID